MVNVAYIGVQDVIKTLCLRENDTKMSMGAIYASYLPTVYNDLRFGVTKRTVTKKYYLDLVNNSLALPDDCLLVVGLGYLDSCGSIKPIWYNNRIPTPMLFENSLPCDCPTCGEENTSCGLIKSFDTVEEVVTINSVEYTNYVKTTILTDGTIIKTTRTYGLQGDTVVPFDTQEEICTLDTLPCGCVATTPSNTLKIKDCCSLNTGCGSYSTSCCDNEPTNTYKIDVQGRLLILSSNYDKDYVIIKYVTALNEASDYKIPTIALETVIRGIKYYWALDDKKAPAYSRGQNSMTHRVYKAELNKLKKRLNPTNWDRLMDAMGIMSTKKQVKQCY